MNDLRSWSWLVPGFLFCSFMGVLIWLAGSARFEYCQGAVILAMFLLAVQTVKSYREYWRGVEIFQERERRSALSLSAETRMAEAYQHMHPETARLVLNYNKTVWLIDECDDVEDLCEWYLRVDQRVNARFVVWVLQHSNPYSIMPMHGILNDGKKTWDKTVTDRMMYSAFCDVLIRRNMLTQPNGNQPGLWIEPWNPERCAKRFGVLHLMEEDAEEASVGE